MNYSIARIFAVILWLGTFPFVAPAQIVLPKGGTLLWGILLIYSFPVSRETSPWFYFMVEYGYWIGIMMLLATSWLVILVTGKSKRVAKVVALMDVGVIGVSILTSIFWFAL
jgi:hypothetical protein